MIRQRQRFPVWLTRSIPVSSTLNTQSVLNRYGLATICESAKCPNRSECYSRSTATFLLLGEVCTRSCSFCSVPSGRPKPPDPDEPLRVACAAWELGLEHVVITSVNRDDLENGGADIFAGTVHEIRNRIPGVTIEVLTPDFCGNWDAMLEVVEAKPDVYNHNMETVRRLYAKVRPRAMYERSLELLARVKEAAPDIRTKSGFMVGVGETGREITELLIDVRNTGCDIVTAGQYLQPISRKMDIVDFVPPSRFLEIEREAKSLGFREAYCGPFVRSSYHAGEVYERSHS
ncbi:MAG: lipoyl synthase [Candidatus Omnitrophica bacterium]|nr:lipoyl synthase [Candidatus Omnitrophota bacterium]